MVADIGFALEGDHVREAGAWGNGDGGVGRAGEFVADVFDEVHAAAQSSPISPSSRPWEFQ
jgi:hypothetical protein